jgi:hypothetical protein
MSLKDAWFLEAPSQVISKRPLSRTLPGGSKVEVRSEAGKNEFMIILARERNNAYPGWAQGSWVLTRRVDTGAAVRIRTFLRSDPNIYVQFRPIDGDKNQDKSLMDVTVYDAYIVHSMPIPFTFERLMTMPVEEVFSFLGDRFPRKYFDPLPALYKDSYTFRDDVRKRLPNLTFRDDGAFDEQGNYVFIETLKSQDGAGGLNCSGFAKWVIDGLLRPVTGKRLAVQPLKDAFGKRGTSFTAAYEDRDLYFGLDWIRNLASIAGKTLLSADFGKQEEFEVRKWTFPLVMERSGNTSAAKSYPGFLEDVGFGIEGLHPLLYTLAVDEPGHVYLAAVNRTQGTPRLRQYFHIAVLVPYFNEQGNFQVTLFESAEETSFARFKTRYPAGHFVNLVRIPLSGVFEP